MSTDLQPLQFPLYGSRLIEASAGTGKTYTIAALYVRLVLGHGGAQGYGRPLAPSEILVMTFTRASTKELVERIRARLVTTALAFRTGAAPKNDLFLEELLDDYADPVARNLAAHRLTNAAEAMDDAAIFTIDAWCQRMLREHAFDSGCMFDETLTASESLLLRDAVRDYWRTHVYALDAPCLAHLRACWDSLHDLDDEIDELVKRARHFGGVEATLSECIIKTVADGIAAARRLKAGQETAVDAMEAWIALHRRDLHGNKLRAATVAACFTALHAWIADDECIQPPAGFLKGCEKLDPAFLIEVHKNKSIQPLAEFAALLTLRDALAHIEPVAHCIKRHAAAAVAARIATIKAARHEFGFADLLVRLRLALEGVQKDALRRRIVAQFPVAMIDEFQDTAPDQYRVFNALYDVAGNARETALFLIGDPKQAIYGFRGADIFNYLAARRATTARHYRLGTNFRSTHAMVAAVNHLFDHAERRKEDAVMPGGAFRFRHGADNPILFEPVAACGRSEALVGHCPSGSAMTLWCHEADECKVGEYRAHFADLCAQQIADLLNDPKVGFLETVDGEDRFKLLELADIAILVRNKIEAAAVRDALGRRGVPSVYLSDKDFVFQSEEAADLLRWLHAVASPLDAALARTAYATATTGLSIARLACLAGDDLAWEACIEQLKTLRSVWQRQGVLAMVRRLLHELGLPARLLATPGGERRLTNLLHLAELLQTASVQLDGEQALVRWFAGEIDAEAQGNDEAILRLESDAQLVKVITIHASKGLEYPLVFVPFAVTARVVTRKNEKIFDYVDAQGKRHIDLARTDTAMAAMDLQRLEEDIRVLYVAATRARHALWLGVMSMNNKLNESGFGHLLNGPQSIPGNALLQALQKMAAGCASIRVAQANAVPPFARLSRRHDTRPLVACPAYDAQFERNWSISSYTAMTRDVGAVVSPSTAAAEKLYGDEQGTSAATGRGAVWHRFPRGALPGQFLHDQMEWLAREGFECLACDDGRARLRLRIARAGWEHRADDALAWLERIATTTLPPVGRHLGELDTIVPEMEFWAPAASLHVGALDAICQRHILPGMARPALLVRSVNGMVRGFMDLVIELEGAYWVMDYKSNWLGPDDGAYGPQGLSEGMCAHRYDVQGAIYLHALHRLLQARLGAAYDPRRHLGGVVFYFMRGLDHPKTRGCFHLAPHTALVDALDTMLAGGSEINSGVSESSEGSPVHQGADPGADGERAAAVAGVDA